MIWIIITVIATIATLICITALISGKNTPIPDEKSIVNKEDNYNE